MKKTVRIGNLALSTTADGLKEMCAPFGRIARVRVAESPLSGKSRGFAFVEMSSDSEAASCIAGLNDRELDGRKLVAVDASVTEAKRYLGQTRKAR